MCSLVSSEMTTVSQYRDLEALVYKFEPVTYAVTFQDSVVEQAE